MTESATQSQQDTKLLLVEDDAALSGYLAAALGDRGYLVQTAVDHSSALACIDKPEPPALILLDLGLPPQPSTAREGLRVLTDALRLVPAAKVVVLTGQDEAAAAQQAVRLGAFDFLTKPATLDAVLQALHRAALFLRQEARMAHHGEARFNIVTRLSEGPKEAGAQAEELLLRRSFATVNYNVTELARLLGLSRENVYYYLNKYGIRRPD